MLLDFDKNITDFIVACNRYDVKMLMVSGGAVNFHGYQRHSADIDFWLETSEKNLINLKSALLNIGFEDFVYPKEIKDGLQNMSIEISPVSDIELITRFNPGRTFEEVWKESIDVALTHTYDAVYKVVPLNDLIHSKLRSARNKDLLDIQELRRANKLK